MKKKKITKWKLIKIKYKKNKLILLIINYY